MGLPERGICRVRQMKEVWLRGVDLNHRPLGYEGKTVRHSIRTWQAKSKRNPRIRVLLLSRLAPFHTLFTDKTRTV
jgi:hypothetical protein